MEVTYLFDLLVQALLSIFQLPNLFAIIIGVAFGLFVGVLPGLSVTMGIALMLPLTFGLPPTAAILLLLGVYCAGTYAGSASAILINNPGTIAAAATAPDGFSLAQKGKASYALNLAIYASVAGGLFSGLVLLLFAPQVANFALNFGPPEYFMLALFGLTVISSVSGKEISKGLVMAAIGMLVATIGIDPVGGAYRFTFDNPFLLSGIDIVPAIVGLFAIAEIFRQMEAGAKSISSTTKYKKERFKIREFWPFKKTVLKSSVIGTIVGVVPGTGGVIAAYLGYNEAKRVSKKPDSYGKGNPDGIVAAETANNGVTGATLIPMMTLGIPGDAPTAVLLGALLIQGLTPGPELFTTYGAITYSVIIGFFLVNIFLFFEAKMAIRIFAKVIHVPPSILWPTVLGLCLVGSYAVDNSLYSVIIALVFGVIGYILPKFNYPITPLLIGIVLGPIAERSLVQSLIISDGSLMIFFTRPITIVFMILIIISVVASFISIIKSNKKAVG